MIIPEINLNQTQLYALRLLSNGFDFATTLRIQAQDNQQSQWRALRGALVWFDKPGNRLQTILFVFIYQFSH